MRWIAAGLAALALTACGPQIGELEKGERGRVGAVFDGDTLALDSGLRVTLTGIEAPFGSRPFAREARAGLERLALNRPAHLAYGGLRRLAPRAAAPTLGPAPAAAAEVTEADAPAETALAHVFVRSEGGRWIRLQEAMVAEGLARTRKENHARHGALLAAEAEARAAGRGLWALADYQVLSAEAAVAQAETLPNRCGAGPFLIVEGRVRAVSANDNRVYLNFGEDYRSDFTIGIYGDSVGDWSVRGPAFDAYEGQQVRVRGRAANRGGPLICADHPEQIEVLAPA